MKLHYLHVVSWKFCKSFWLKVSTFSPSSEVNFIFSSSLIKPHCREALRRTCFWMIDWKIVRPSALTPTDWMTSDLKVGFKELRSLSPRKVRLEMS